MILSKIELKGFRNYKKAEINLSKKSLIIGANDVGKTNLLWAIRLLLDRGLSDYDIEPQDSDFYAYDETNEFEIVLHFTNVVEDCVVSRMKGKISDDDEMCLMYKGYRDKITKAKTFKLFAGKAINDLEEIEDRYYRKVLNIKYISSKRDLHNYIKREKNYLFQIAKEERTEEETQSDDKLYSEIQNDLKLVDEKIPALKFISTATNTINDELSKLSLHHKKQKVVFDASTSNVDSFINNVSIAAKSNEENVLIGGDGRLNQIYLALWASRNGITEESLTEVTIFCIEEPEAHLHPHQQRKLAEYLNLSLNGQVILTSHSPQITSEFSPNSIVRLLNKENSTTAASDGCSKIIEDAFLDFGYRKSIISAEAFFSDVVFLVEGPSEDLFYKTLSKQIDIDLDRLNISVLMVDGIGFKTYINILNSLDIDWVLRTDNDIFKVPKKDEYRFAGVQRCISYYKEFFISDKETDKLLLEHENNLQWSTPNPEIVNIESAKIITKDLENYGMFLSFNDLENDFFNSSLNSEIKDFFSDIDETEIVSGMQKRKATFMFNFLKNNTKSLSKLKDDNISKPLLECKSKIELIQNETN
ncbi:AAA family ATPase [Algibacter sp. AS12]|uniref:ATP-dependent nuclease n=1 Tax=Algibacter sp. AS12 TaxID=3135773 RepID=UPI00398B03EE